MPYGDAEALAAAVDEDTAAVFLEPIAGRERRRRAAGRLPGGGARDHRPRAGALLVLDEIQTGIGRTGAWFAHQGEGVLPDVVTLAKGLGGGLPIGACVAFGPAAELLGPGSHGSTFGGNPVCAAAALAVLDTIEAEGLVAHAATVGGRLAAGIEGLEHPLVSYVRGRGLLLGVVLTAPAARSWRRRPASAACS